MSTEALLAILGLLFAVVPLLPEERRRDIQVRLHRADVVAIIATVVVLHVIKFYPLLHQNGLVPTTGPWRYGLDAESASYLLLLVVSIVVGLRIWRRPIAASRLPALRELVETQLQHRHYGNLAALLRWHWDRLVILHRPDGTLQARLLQRFDDRPGIVVVREKTVRGATGSAKSLLGLRRWLARRFAGAEVTQDRIDDIFNLVLLHDGFVAYIASTDIALALRIVSYESRLRFEFQARLFNAIMSDTQSVFYREIRNNTNLLSGHRYDLPSRNRLLCYYLSNPKVAEKLRVYRPIGDFAIHWLSQRTRQGKSDEYNSDFSEHFREVEAWQCPAHAAIKFFDIMVLEALHHRVAWHMWLYYYPLFVKGILANVTSRRENEDHHEWPTPYHFLLSRMFSAMSGWIQESATLSESDPAIGAVKVDLEHDNGSIPKSAVIALGSSLRSLLMASAVTDRFKSSVVSLLLLDLREILRHPNAKTLGHAMALSIALGDYQPKKSQGAEGYRYRILLALRGADSELCFHLAKEHTLPELGALIAEARGFKTP